MIKNLDIQQIISTIGEIHQIFESKRAICRKEVTLCLTADLRYAS